MVEEEEFARFVNQTLENQCCIAQDEYAYITLGEIQLAIFRRMKAGRAPLWVDIPHRVLEQLRAHHARLQEQDAEDIMYSEGQYVMLLALVDREFDLNDAERCHLPPLWYAVYMQNTLFLHVVLYQRGGARLRDRAYLMKAHSDVRMQLTALQLALYQHDFECVHMLYNAGQDDGGRFLERGRVAVSEAEDPTQRVYARLVQAWELCRLEWMKQEAAATRNALSRALYYGAK